MAHAWAVRCSPVVGLALLMVATSLAPAVAAQDAGSEAKLERIRELMEVREQTRLVTPLPGSRSVIVVADISTPLFFFLERGSIRGSAIDQFYEAYESGDAEAAYGSFLRNSIMTLRITDYGWNGLGEPMVTEAGSEIQDNLFRNVEGVFARVSEITEEDRASYQELLDALLTVLEDSA